MSEMDGHAQNVNPEAVVTPTDSSAAAGPNHDAILSTLSLSTTSGVGTRTPQSIGPYQLLRRLGEGGMGQVWLAEQTAPIHRQVALKLIKFGRYDDSVLQRFYAERQSLATMDHPAIAKVFEAGATADGQPYFVMEYVPGEPITGYCNRRQLKIQERLELFIKVCEGVQHAHHKAVMHRDLKPANILVIEVDGKAVPRIIDFGLAKAAGPRIDGEKLLTQMGGWVGTPGYMSPEQADPRVMDVDTRTDVYSLGVVLYELLTDTLPFDPTGWRSKPLYEVLRQLQQDDPPSPSTRVALRQKRSSARGEATPETRQLVWLLNGDLDWITLKALERKRARRYDSCSAFADDLRRYLNHEPVLAAPPSVMYRVGKFVRRNRVAVAGVSAVAIMLVALAVSMTWQAVRISRERDRANREAMAAKGVSDFLTRLFRVSDPSEARGSSVTARQILDQGVQRIDTELATQPEVQARLMGTMGEVYWSLGLYREAEPLLRQAVEKRRRLLGAEHPDTLQSMYALAKNLNDQGHYAEAEKELENVLEARRRVLGPQHRDTIDTMVAIAGVIYGAGRYQEAESRQRQLLALFEKQNPRDEKRIIIVKSNLAVNLGAQGRDQEAEAMYRDVLEAERRVYGADHPLFLQTEQNSAIVLHSERKYDEEETLLRSALDAQNRILGPDHEDTLWTKHLLGVTLREKGRLQDAERIFRETIPQEERTLGAEHPNTVGSMEELAVTLDDLKRFRDAEHLYQKVLDIQERILGVDNPVTAATRYNLACNAALQGQRDRAIDILREAITHGLIQATINGIGADEDLKSLHGDQRFEALVAHAKN